MPDLTERIASLPPEKRQLFEKLLKQERLEIRRPVIASVIPSDIPRQPRGQGTHKFVTSFAQARLWFLDQFAPGSSAYNMPFALRLKGALVVAALERAMTEVITRHEVLRTRFAVEEGEPVQVVDEPKLFVLPVVQVSEKQEIEQLIREEASQPFDLEVGPLVRAKLLRISVDQHVLVFTMHHIVSDGWSMGVLMREVGALYDAYSCGAESPLSKLAIQYADYAVWQREWLRGEALERQLDYWRKQLADAPATLDLPVEKARPAVLSSQTAQAEVQFPGAAVTGLRELGRLEGCTLFMTFLTALQIVMWRYSRQRDLVVGTPVANRKQSGTEGLIGFFVNTLALRTQLDETKTFRELLAHVRETCLGAYAHQDVPFEKLVEELGVKREPNRNPLFDVMLVLQGAGERGVPGLGGLEVKAEEWGGAGVLGAKFDLLLWLTEERDGRVRGKLEYRAELFGEELMRRMVQHLSQVVEQAAASGGKTKLCELGLIGEAERHRQLIDWNDTYREYERDLCVHELFETQVERTPQAVALICGSEELSYRDLNRRANQLAHYLKRKGVGPELVVGLLMERSVEMVVSLLAILKAGGAYLPLDPRHPEKRLRMMLEDAGATLLLTQGQWSGGPLSDTANVVCLDEERDSIANESNENLPCATAAENLIYLMYTSGSTGVAKGVAVTHRSVVRLVRGANYVELGPEQVLLLLAPMSFDASTFEVWGALLNGARLVVAPPGPLSLEEVGRVVRESRVTTLWLTAGLFHQMVDERPDDLRGVRQLLAGGDVLSPRHVRTVLEASDGGVVVNGYGPTENTTFTACNRLSEAIEVDATVSIGRPISNTQIYILDDALQPVPVGVAGELYTGGDGLARGYLQRPRLTAERFVPNPFSRTGGGRMYRTGDVARYLEDGRIEFAGRMDHQVKVRGYRIEPGEIEAAVTGCAGVRECVVVVREDARGEKLLVAYFVGESEEPLRPGELRASLRERLPDYMIPSVFVLLDELPLTPNGKVDRRALPAPEQTNDRTGDSSQAPRTPTEEVLAEIFADVLHVTSVGIGENFFELGGHSLLATRVVSQVRTTFGVEVALRTLFEQPTVAGWSEEIETLLRAESESEVPPLVKRESAEPAPLSFAQQRLWFLDQFEPGSSAYNMPFALRLTGELHVAAMERALTEVVRRHEVLRTTFSVVDEQPVQVVGEMTPFVLPVVQVGEHEQVQRVRQLIREEATQPFDLEHGPLARARLLKLGEQEHVLLFTMHHIVSDGWSMDVLMKEVGALYDAYQHGKESPLEELSIQYADYAVWQREWLQDEALDRQLEYWRKQLADAPALELPTDRPRPAVQRFEGATVSFVLDAGLTDGLRDLSRREGATLFITLLAVFQTLLTRYTGQSDVSVGTPVAGRTRAETEALVGFFVNTLVLRVDASGDPTFSELIGRVKDACLGAYAHQDVPFEKLVEELQPDREMSRSPLFQVMFTLQNAPRETLTLPGVTLSILEGENRNAKFDLMLTMAEGNAGLQGWFEYNTDLFDAEPIERMAQHFQTLVQSIVAEPSQPASALRLMDQSEQLRVVVDWNNTAAVYAQAEKCIQEIFAEQVEKTPDHIALVSSEGSLRYAELNSRANQLAHYLRKRGVGPESLVGIMIERSTAMVVALLGILKAGGSYLPLDPDYPRDRLSFMLSDAGVEVLLSETHLSERLPQTGSPVILVDAERDAIQQESDANPVTAATPDNLAYVLYTSGSTGQPKGAMLAHREVVNCVLWMQQTYELNAADRMLCKTTLNFDPSVWEVFWPLMVGSRIVLTTPGAQLDSAALLQTIIDEQATVAYFVPSMLALFLSEPEVANAISLRKVICGGESLGIELVKRFYELLPQATLHHSYGPTETAIASSETICDPHSRHSVMPIGRPLANTQLYVLDAQMQPAPIGILGELFIGGGGLGRGYLNRPDLTAEKFIPDHFSNVPGARLYRTGDRVRYLADGNLQFQGRSDAQVKVRGIRIELGEIEAAIMAHGNVHSTVVDARQDGEKSLVGYVVAAQGASLTAAEIRQALSEKLPTYMVPSSFVFLSELPLLPNGKVDRRALPVPDEARDVDGSSAPRTPTEEMLAEIFADVLRVASVGVAENFFVLGGHSLLATRVVSRVRTAFGVDVALRTLFEQPTVAGLSEEIETLRQVGAGLEVPPLVRRESVEAAPLSFAQARLWFLDQFEPGSSAYNMPFALRLKGSLDVTAIERALSEVVRRHEVLRTRFAVEEGEPVQVVDEPAPFVLPVVQVSEAQEQAQRVRQLIQEEASLPFDLETGQLVRAKLLKLSTAEHVFLFTMHHIVSDGWSMGVLMREVGTLYDTYSRGADSPLAELPIQYADYAVWQREWLRDEALERQLDYWRKQLADAPVLELPTERARPASLSAQSAEREVRISADAVAGLRELGRREGCTLFMTLLAVFEVVLGRYTGQSDLVVGTPVANRGQGGTEGLIGFFVNTLALRTELNERLTFRELLGRVRETCLGAYAHQDVPFEKLVEELGVRREMNRNPLFDVMLVLQGAVEQGVPRLEGLEVSAEGLGTGSVGAKFDLLLGLSEESGGGVRGKLEYRAELFGEELMRRMGQHLECAVEEVVAHGGEGTLGELRLLSEEERRLQLVEWNDTFRDYERERCVHELFEAQVERTSQALGLVFGGEELSYRELNRRANQLAHYLKRKGVGPESVVGVLMDRSSEMIISLLAILKAGGAYLPLDPEYPAARLRMMLEDSGAALLITRSALAERVLANVVTVVCLEDERESIAAESDENLTCTTTAENLIYVMYTSGSTGRPKGVAVTHRSVMRLVKGANYVELGPEQVLLQLAPTTFDAATFEIWGALLNGARLVIAPPGPLSLEEIGRTVRESGVTTLWLTAGLFHQMVDQRAEDLSGVRQLLAGGDVLSPRHVRTVLEACESNVLVNGYGPTENTTFTACHRITNSTQIGETVSIGRPISNTQIYILDEGMRPAPVGVVGELYTGGNGLARGYLRGASLTAERFVPNPFSELSGRLYRTGDLARYMEDGRIEFLGRMDEQVKVRGFRIEPGEIEAAVIECEGVRECVALVREARGEKLLVAYVVAESAEPPRSSELRASLRERLPDYMVPSTFVMLDEMPLTPNGKVDRRALPALDGSRPELESRYVEPRTSLEKLLAEMWQDVLEIEAVGIHDDFFELGGTSLRVVVFVNKLQQRLGVHVPVKTLFSGPNVAALAEYLKDAHPQTISGVYGDDDTLSLMTGLQPATGSWSPVVEIQPGTTKTPLFFVHPVGGNVFCYFNLARRLGPDQPFYALQSIGLNDGQPGHTRIEEMASYYVEHLRAVQPTGPYRIGGWSLGGVVAFEMARQLKASGDEVLMLTLIDSPSPSEFARLRNDDDLSQLASFAIDLGFTQEQLSRSFADVRLLSLEEQLAYMLDRARVDNLVPAGMELDHLHRLFHVFKTNREALCAYVPGVYAGQVTYVQATGNGAADMPRDWHELALGGVDVYQLPGDHYSILKQPYVDALAQCIEQRVRTLENGNGAPRQ